MHHIRFVLQVAHYDNATGTLINSKWSASLNIEQYLMLQTAEFSLTREGNKFNFDFNLPSRY